MKRRHHTWNLATGLALTIYLVGVLGFANIPVWNSLARLTGGIQIPPCGCTDPDCQCGAPCCSPEAKALRAAVAAGDLEAAARITLPTASACCATSAEGDQGGCHCGETSARPVLTTACLCGRTCTLAVISFGENHLAGPVLADRLCPHPLLLAPAATPAPCPGVGTPPDKVPIGS